MLFALLDQKDFAQCATLRQLTGPRVFRRETERLGIHELHVRIVTCRDHGIGIVERRRQWLFTDHMLASFSSGNRHLGVQIIRQCQRNDVDLVEFQQISVIGQRPGNVVPFREIDDPMQIWRGHRHNLTIGRLRQRIRVHIRDEAGSDDPGPNRFHSQCPCSRFDRLLDIGAQHIAS